MVRIALLLNVFLVVLGARNEGILILAHTRIGTLLGILGDFDRNGRHDEIEREEVFGSARVKSSSHYLLFAQSVPLRCLPFVSPSPALIIV
jgi:hypothetical protein